MEAGEPQLSEKKEEENLHMSLQKEKDNSETFRRRRTTFRASEKDNLQMQEDNLQMQEDNLHREHQPDLMQRNLAEAALNLIKECPANREYWRAVQMNLEE